jgi:predicted RNA-binding protein (virulence factor B family)
LDIDEGLRIESSSKDTRLFINKSASATFVLQLCNNKDEKENINNNNNNNNFVYFDSAEELIKYIKIKFGRNFSIWSY